MTDQEFHPEMIEETDGKLREPNSKELKSQYERYRESTQGITPEAHKTFMEEDQEKRDIKTFKYINVIIVGISILTIIWGITASNPSSSSSIISIPLIESTAIPTVIPLEIVYTAKPNKIYNTYYSDWEINNNVFNWKIEGNLIGSSILTLFDPAGLNPALPYFIEIDNNTHEIIISATLIDCLRCRITSVNKNLEGNYIYSIPNNGLYETHPIKGLVNKTIFPLITNKSEIKNNVITFMDGQLLSQAIIPTNLNETTFINFQYELPFEISSTIREIKTEGSDFINILSENPTRLLTINKVYREQERLISNLTISNPVSFIEQNAAFWIYDVGNSNVDYTSKIVILDKAGKVEKSFTEFYGIPLGDSQESKIKKGENSTIIIQDSGNNRIIYIDIITQEPIFSIQGNGHIINGYNQTIN